MKKFLLGLLLLSVISCNTPNKLQTPSKIIEKEGFELKIELQPNSEYITDLTQETNTDMVMPNMPAQNSTSNVSSKSTIKFGPLVNNQSEMLIVFDEMDMEVSGVGVGQGKTPTLKGMKVHGKLKEGIQSIDSIVGVDQSVQSMMENLMEPLFSSVQIDFPNPMNIGDEFMDTKVTELPIQEIGSASITTNTKYTLIKVMNDLADLSTEINVTGTMLIMGNEFPLKGTGSGKMIVDLKQKYATSSTTNLVQEMTMEMQGTTIDQKVTSYVSTKTRKVK